MKFKALLNFSGEITCKIGDIIDIADKVLYEDLLKAKYIEKVEDKQEEKKEHKDKK